MTAYLQTLRPAINTVVTTGRDVKVSRPTWSRDQFLDSISISVYEVLISVSCITSFYHSFRVVTYLLNLLCLD